MSKSDSFLSKEQERLLKQFRKQIRQPQTHLAIDSSNKDVSTVINSSNDQEKVDDSIALFQQAVQGVKKLDSGNIAQISKSKPKKLDAQLLAKRVAAEGDHTQEHAELSDTQAALNPVGSQQTLNYRIATLQHKVFEDLKTGKLRWFEAVDLHGCTVEEARQAVLQIIQMAKDENQNVIKIVHGKGPEAILKTYVNGWLRQHRDVIAFVSAPENQGGTGAVLVLLKRAEKNPKYQQQS